MQLEWWFDIVRLRLRSLLRRNAVEGEMDRELQFHLDQEIEKNICLGLPPAEARSAALRCLGAVTQIRRNAATCAAQAGSRASFATFNTQAGCLSKPRCSR
jgi:hypothetical protein